MRELQEKKKKKKELRNRVRGKERYPAEIN